MREVLIKAIPFDDLKITELEGVQQVNEHGELVFSGLMRGEKESEYISWALKKNPLVSVNVCSDSGEEKILFQGVLVDFEIQAQNDVRYLTGVLRTNTYLLDLIPHKRSFQADRLQYQNLLTTVNNGYTDYIFIMAKGAGSNIPGLVMQYDETDWAFIKRMASRFHTVVIPDSQRDHIAYTFGLPEDGVHYAVETNIFSIAKNAGQIIESEDQRMPRADTFFYVLNSREIYRLGDCVTLNGVPLRVYSIKTKMEGSELYHTYYLTSESGFETEEVFNENLIGLSLDAQVTSVERDTVQVLIGCDENQAGCGTRVFPYATVYSTPDGTGWYCMPEIGDAVRLYFPCEKDADAYVASSVHLQSSAGDERINPDFKSIMNKQKKEILFTPGSLLLTNNAGMSIELSDAEGIKIISDKAIVVQSQEAVDISSATSSLSISAPQRIIFQQGNTQMSLEEKLHFGGAQVRID